MVVVKWGKVFESGWLDAVWMEMADDVARGGVFRAEIQGGLSVP